MARHADLGMVAALALIAGAGDAVFHESSPLQVPVATLLVLWLPGYALAAALFVRGELTRMERLLVSLGLSIAIAILSGLTLNWIGVPLSRSTWGFVLGGMTLVATAVAWRRSPPLPAHARSLRLALPSDISGALLFGAAGLVAALAIVVASLGAIDQPRQGFTELWMVPASDGRVRIGVSNEESQPMSYRVVLRDETASVGEWPMIQLRPGQEWDTEVTGLSSTGQNLDLLLYRADAPDAVYRRVALPAPSTPPAP